MNIIDYKDAYGTYEYIDNKWYDMMAEYHLEFIREIKMHNIGGRMEIPKV